MGVDEVLKWGLRWYSNGGINKRHIIKNIIIKDI